MKTAGTIDMTIIEIYMRTYAHRVLGTTQPGMYRRVGCTGAIRILS